jgi:hypothetical protein
MLNLEKNFIMGSLGMPEVMVMLIALIIPAVVIVIAYKLGKRSGENKILKQMYDRDKLHKS